MLMSFYNDTKHFLLSKFFTSLNVMNIGTRFNNITLLTSKEKLRFTVVKSEKLQINKSLYSCFIKFNLFLIHIHLNEESSESHC